MSKLDRVVRNETCTLSFGSRLLRVLSLLGLVACFLLVGSTTQAQAPTDPDATSAQTEAHDGPLNPSKEDSVAAVLTIVSSTLVGLTGVAMAIAGGFGAENNADSYAVAGLIAGGVSLFTVSGVGFAVAYLLMPSSENDSGTASTHELSLRLTGSF